MPAIHLQEATPDSLMAPAPASPVWESAPPSPSPSSIAPVLPIHIPQTGDAAMQQFFHDIVGQLSVLHTSSAPPSPTPSGRSSFLPYPTPAPSPLLPAGEQFEDAEDDESDAGTDSILSHYAHRPDRYSAASSSQQSRHSSSLGGDYVIVPKLVAPPLVPRPATRASARPTSRTGSPYEGDKENARGAVGLGIGGVGSGMERRQPMGLAIQSGGVPDFDEELLQSPHPRLQKRKKRECPL